MDHPLVVMALSIVLGLVICCCINRVRFGFWTPWDSE